MPGPASSVVAPPAPSTYMQPLTEFRHLSDTKSMTNGVPMHPPRYGGYVVRPPSRSYAVPPTAADGRLRLPVQTSEPPDNARPSPGGIPCATFEAATLDSGPLEPQQHWLSAIVVEKLTMSDRAANRTSVGSILMRGMHKEKTRCAGGEKGSHQFKDDDVGMISADDTLVSSNRSAGVLSSVDPMHSETSDDISEQFQGQRALCFRRREWISRMGRMAQCDALCDPTPAALAQAKTSRPVLRRYKHLVARATYRMVPLPFSKNWPNVSPAEAWQWSLGGALSRRLSRNGSVRAIRKPIMSDASDIRQALSGMPVGSELREECEALMKSFCTASQRLASYSRTAPALDSLSIISPIHVYSSSFLTWLRHASYSSVIARQEEAREEDASASLIPLLLYLVPLRAQRPLSLRCREPQRPLCTAMERAVALSSQDSAFGVDPLLSDCGAVVGTRGHSSRFPLKCPDTVTTGSYDDSVRAHLDEQFDQSPSNMDANRAPGTPAAQETSSFEPSKLSIVSGEQLEPFTQELRLTGFTPRYNDTIWDMDEIVSGPLWDDCVVERLEKAVVRFQPAITGTTRAVLWGQCSSESEYLPSYRYLVNQAETLEPAELNELLESFDAVDRLTHHEVLLQSRLIHSLGAYCIRNPVEQALAFGSLVMDVNDDELFFSCSTSAGGKTSERCCSVPFNTPELVYDEPLWGTLAAEKDALAQDRGDTEDTVSCTSSSGSLSDVVDDWLTLGTPAMAGIAFAAPVSSRDAIGKDTKMPDKKMQLKKRSQEKEKRIRLALLGLAPQMARNVDDIRRPPPQAADPLLGPALPPPTPMTAVTQRNAIKEYRNLRRQYRSLQTIQRLHVTLEGDTTRHDPYAIHVRPGLEQRDQLELKHSVAAFLFLGLPTRPFPVYVTRFHRPDFRWGFYEMHMNAVPQGVRQLSTHATGKGTTTGASRAGAGSSSGRLILHLGQRRLSHQDSSSSHQGGGEDATTPGQLWGTWIVRAPRISTVVRRARALQDGVFVEHGAGVDGLNVSNDQALGDESRGAATSFRAQVTRSSAMKHPADLITTAEDLTLTDMAPIALFEYAEQLPPLLNNMGMVAQISKYYRPPSDNITLAQAKKKIRGRLGRFGRLKLADGFIPFFGSQMKLARNQGVVTVQSRLFKAPLFPHPTNPHSPLKVDPARANTSRYGTSRFHDFRATDFLLIRSRPSPASHISGLQQHEGTRTAMHVYLRPIYLEPLSDRMYGDEGEDDHDGSSARCTVYTVGQTEPLGEVPPPTSKRCLEIRRDWLRAYALRLARQGITDFHTVKTRCQAKFHSIFDPGVIQKHLMSCRDALASSSTTSPVYTGQGMTGVTIRVVNEEYLQAVCSPELLCALESAMVANSRLLQAGLMLLRAAERVSTAVRDLETEEATAREHLARARKQLTSYGARYTQLISSLSPTHPFRVALAQDSNFSSGASLALFELICGKRYGPVARFIEEMLLLTPWNVTRDCIDVISRHGGQFSLDGIGDPSGGRGEGISLIRVHYNRDAYRSGALAARGGSGNSAGPKSLETPKEDLRKLSMKELHDRLIKYGFDNQTVKSLPRWDQVALVRTFQCDYTNVQTEDASLFKSGRLPNELYIKRLNEIFLSQRRALEADEPHITASDSDSPGPVVNNGDDDEDTDRSLSGAGGSLPEMQGNSQSTTVEGAAKEDLAVDHVQGVRPLQAPSQCVGPEANLEDELLSGLQSGSDDEGRTTEQGGLSSSQHVDASERKALEEFRQSLGKARNAAEVEVSSRMTKLFSPKELRLLQTKPIPRLKWTRKTRDNRTGEVKSEKIIYIYGSDNIRLFYEWRRRRSARKRFLDTSNSIVGGQSQMGTASRTCRRCGQMGHISSNPICPQYTGPRKARATHGVSTATPANTRQLLLSPTCGSSDEDTGSDHKSGTTIECTSTSSLLAAQRGVPGRSKRGPGSSVANFSGGIMAESERLLKAPKYAKGKEDVNGGSLTSLKSNKASDDTASVISSKLPTRTTARQRLILESKGSLAGGAVQSYQGSFESAVNEINQIFQRVISKTDRDKRKWAVFREKVLEADAPGYNAVVTNPIWLNKMVEKCKAREYRSTATFLSDIQLLVDNCFRYNPPGHWIRPLVQSLGDFLREETESQGPWLIELDRFIQEHLQEQLPTTPLTQQS